ncbi:MAG: metalloregulator ArsR/SmtB family transcription factor [Acidobacteriota bacterium]
MPTTLSELQTFKAEFFRALAHPVRIRILEVLRAGPQTVQQLQQALDLDQPSVSQHLAVLRARQLVVASKSGNAVVYDVRDVLIHDLLATARTIFNRRLTDTQDMLKELARESRRTR